MRDFHCLLGVLLDEQDGLSTGVDAQELVEDDCNGRGRQADRRFVNEQDLRPLQDGHRHFQQLLFAAGHVARQRVAARLQDRKQVINIVPVGLHPGIAKRVGGHLEIFVDRHDRKITTALRDEGDALGEDRPRLVAGDILALPFDAAVLDRRHSIERLQERRLAGPVRPHQGNELPLRHVEVDAVEDIERAVACAKALDRETGINHRDRPPAPPGYERFRRVSLRPACAPGRARRCARRCR